ncbi:unnamed protein product, partial [Polarella glacialis]
LELVAEAQSEVVHSTALVLVEAEDEDLFLHFIKLRREERQRIREEQELQRQQKLGKQPARALEDSGASVPPAALGGEASASQESQQCARPTRPPPGAPGAEKRGRGRPPGKPSERKPSE